MKKLMFLNWITFNIANIAAVNCGRDMMITIPTVSTELNQIIYVAFLFGFELFYSYAVCANSGEKWTEISVKSLFQLNLSPHLVIPSSNIKLNETTGQGRVIPSCAVIIIFVIQLYYTCVCLCIRWIWYSVQGLC